MRADETNDRETNAALFAAGALPSDESNAIIEGLLHRDPDTLAAIAPWFSVIATLSELDRPMTAPPDLRAKILAHIEDQKGSAPVLHRLSEMPWEATSIQGVWKRLLFRDASDTRNTTMIRLEPGAFFPAHAHRGIEEVFLIEGDLTHEQTTLKPGDYQRFAAGSRHEVQSSKQGCIAIIITTIISALQ